MTVHRTLDRLAAAYPGFSPQLQLAARYVLDNPKQVALNSMRRVADHARVTPNTLVRMARSLGFDGYDAFREPFRDSLDSTGGSFQDRAKWLQSMAKGKKHDRLYHQMVTRSLGNLEQTFADTSPAEVKQAADLIARSRSKFVYGEGTCFSLAHNFWYVARMAFDNLRLVPSHGGLPIDDIAHIGRRDVLVAITFEPYRTEVVEAVARAKTNGGRVVALSDSRASPIALAADHALVVATDTPQFFTSIVAAMCLLEALIAFMIADSGRVVVDRIDRFHRARFDTGVYHRPDA